MLHRSFSYANLIDRCTLSLDQLFTADIERQAFLARLSHFIDSDASFSRIIRLSADHLSYDSESFIPAAPNPRKRNLFLIVGNPAPDSVARKAMYAYEGTRQRPHRFWKVLHNTGVLCFSHLDPDFYSPQMKMRRLFTGAYSSPLNVHILPFFSLASPAAGQWNGVAGLRRLFGRRFAEITSAELTALRDLLDAKATEGDCVLVFQKDAYLALKPSDGPQYNIAELRERPLKSCYGGTEIDLICLPPTRLLYSQVTQRVLRRVAQSAQG